MYVDPFWAGVVCTIMVEFLLLMGWAIISSTEKK